jgi:phosphoribosylpyrophosphate synthetase
LRPAPLCDECRKTLDAPAECVEIDGRPTSYALRYEPPISNLIIAFKDRGEWSLRTVLARLLTRSICDLLLNVDDRERSATTPVLLVPIASTSSSIRIRDADPISDLAVSAARTMRRSGFDVRASRVLMMRSGHRDHVGLSRSERETNMRNAFAVDGRHRADGVVVLVDDVVTSGASLAAAQRALSMAGYRVVGAAVIARSGHKQQTGDRGWPTNKQTGRRGDTLGV